MKREPIRFELMDSTVDRGLKMKRCLNAKPFALCIDNAGYRASLIPGRVCSLPDPIALQDDLVRIVDESGEDYPCHRDHFVFVDFPLAIRKKLLALQRVA